MARFKSILKRVSIKIASRKRRCFHNNKHQIAKGDLVLEIDAGLQGTSGYCSSCAKEMLSNARTTISQLEQSLSDRLKN